MTDFNQPTPPVRRGLPRPASAAPEVPVAAEVPLSPLPTPSVKPPVKSAWKPPSTPASASPGKGESRQRLSRRVLRLVVVGAAMLALGVLAVLGTRWLLGTAALQDFLATYPGETGLVADAPVGLPAWLGWQHFLNSLLILLIIRSGWQVRTETRPRIFWTPRWAFFGRGKISLAQWFHQSLDLLWVINGAVFFVLLIVTGQWLRIVPTSWEIFPNALSALLQYLSFDWPTENGWVNYNSLQVLAYFTTVFVAAPLAIISGVRLSGLWPTRANRLSRLFPVEWARALHLPVMLYFVAFIIVHVTLVVATGALRNLNHIYASHDAVGWTGFWIFCASIVVMVGSWIAARTEILAAIAQRFGAVGR